MLLLKEIENIGLLRERFHTPRGVRFWKADVAF